MVKKRYNWHWILKLALCIIICLAIGGIGSIFTVPSIDSWYSNIVKPTFNPPSWIFAPVWNILFILMGISLYLIIKPGINKKNKPALTFFVIQLCLNLLWSILFFYLHSPFNAFIDILLLWIAILMTIVTSWKISKAASYLLIPYILWVSFATLLNYYIMILN
ncbi:MAG: TspO/MBR family protein [archaeon]